MLAKQVANLSTAGPLPANIFRRPRQFYTPRTMGLCDAVASQ